ncbi:hypothetical protein OCU04_007120 [Sclerotinia nivalis]|uniref:F-box domain-containing protein n=1 Tax=Sclerotinia nivalis TaxID=352851 RepID=A0A9X0AL59_9HELO|nr:hypothetical protein OCU04_007120 [Sclerotinia nivalis]
MSCACCYPASPSDDRYEPFISTKQLAQRCLLDDRTRKSFTYSMVHTESANNTSHLVKIPIELFQRTLKYLDVETLVNVRRCSQYCRLAISSILEWQEVSNNAPEALRAILSTGIGSNILLLQLHYALTNPECEFCPENSENPAYLDDEKVMGAFLSLFKGKRACAYCLRNDISLRTVQYIDLLRLQLRPDSAVLFPPEMKYPRLRTIPGTYGPSKYKSQQRLVLVSMGSIETIRGKPLSLLEAQVLQRSPHEVMIPKHPLSKRNEMDQQLAPHRQYVGFEREDDIARRYTTAVPFPFFGKTMTHPNMKKLVTFHGCAECTFQEQYHEKQFLESFNQGDADETIIACGANIYKRETRQWLDDMEAEKIHARDFHERIDEEERMWRVKRQAPIFNLSDPKIWKELRVPGY